jgi:DNA-binding HxlR family transcriptional regulator
MEGAMAETLTEEAVKKTDEPDTSRPPCPVETTLKMVGHRWKLLILRELFRGGVKRFNELLDGVTGITPKMLAAKLKEMERDGIVIRKLYPEVPPRVEYSLTRLGRSLRSVMSAIYEWGNEYLQGELEEG